MKSQPHSSQVGARWKQAWRQFGQAFVVLLMVGVFSVPVKALRSQGENPWYALTQMLAFTQGRGISIFFSEIATRSTIRACVMYWTWVHIMPRKKPIDLGKSTRLTSKTELKRAKRLDRLVFVLFPDEREAIKLQMTQL